jgi:transcriptional regulatory protein RtcR
MLFLDEVGELGLDEQSMLLRAVEEKQFLSVGSDTEAHSDFQLICGTNRDLFQDVLDKKFREDLLSRINLWTFEMPGLNKRPEDIQPNLNYELDRFAERTKRHITFNKEARNRFLKFATSPEAIWLANFRDLNGAITRMATLAPGGRITDQVVKDEIHRLSARWGLVQKQSDEGILLSLIGEERTAALDRFEKVQLIDVIRVCQTSKNIAQAGRALFAASRKRKAHSNDSDRLRKYLSKYQIQWGDIHI